MVPPLPLAGSAVDGSKLIHAAGVYKPEISPPIMNKDKNNALFYVGDESWQLKEDDKVLRQYNSEDLRMTVVYRSRCFESEEAMLSFNKRNPSAAVIKPKPEDIDTSSNMKLEDIIETLKADLFSKKLLTEQNYETISKVDLGILLMDTYIKYPYASYQKAAIPFNYCALPRTLKAYKSIAETLLTPLCGSFDLVDKKEGIEDL